MLEMSTEMPEHRVAVAAPARWFARMLDEIDYGILLVSGRSEVLHINHVACAELDADHPLEILGQSLRARGPRDAKAVLDALRDAAQRGVRRMLTVGEGADSVRIAVVPLSSSQTCADAPQLVVLGKRAVCGELAVQCFAQAHSLTHAEGRVLTALCAGRKPSEIAHGHGVSLCTIRTQISGARAKTGAASIRDLIRQVSILPPMVGAIRGPRWTGRDVSPIGAQSRAPVAGAAVVNRVGEVPA